MFFFFLSNIKINFFKFELSSKTYAYIKTISTLKQVELVQKKNFATIALNLKKEIYIV